MLMFYSGRNLSSYYSLLIFYSIPTRTFFLFSYRQTFWALPIHILCVSFFLFSFIVIRYCIFLSLNLYHVCRVQEYGDEWSIGRGFCTHWSWAMRALWKQIINHHIANLQSTTNEQLRCNLLLFILSFHIHFTSCDLWYNNYYS